MGNAATRTWRELPALPRHNAATVAASGYMHHEPGSSADPPEAPLDGNAGPKLHRNAGKACSAVLVDPSGPLAEEHASTTASCIFGAAVSAMDLLALHTSQLSTLAAVSARTPPFSDYRTCFQAGLPVDQLDAKLFTALCCFISWKARCWRRAVNGYSRPCSTGAPTSR
jgi:hypothetical protein